MPSVAQVVVLTHAYGDCSGVRWMTGGLKVYYAPRVPIVSQARARLVFMVSAWQAVVGTCVLMRRHHACQVATGPYGQVLAGQRAVGRCE